MENINVYLKNRIKTNAKGKHYFSLKEICEDLNYNFNNALISVASILEIFKASGFYVSNMMSFVRNEMHDIEDVQLSKEALMFVSADIFKQGITKDASWKQIADEIFFSTDKFYAEKRIIVRQNYSNLINQLNSILASLSYIRAKGISQCFQEIYTVIINNYFRVNSKNELYTKKHLSKGQNYLDYISTIELEHLSWIVKNINLFILNNQFYGDILNAAQTYSKQASEQFIKVYGKTPSMRPAHIHKPKTMLKNYYKILKNYNLQPKNESNDIKGEQK